MEISSLIQTIAISALPVIFAITVHEAAHGYAARHFGDNTAWLAGRISLNPLRHIDPLGTILLPLLLFIINSPFLFGWAKPVPVDIWRLRNPRWGMVLVAAAGPAVNAALAFTSALLAHAVIAGQGWLGPEAVGYLLRFVALSMLANLVLGLFNLLPLPPLDGGRIAVSLLPHRLAWKFAQIERWGFPILLLLLFTGILGDVMNPLVTLVARAIESIFGLY